MWLCLTGLSPSSEQLPTGAVNSNIKNVFVLRPVCIYILADSRAINLFRSHIISGDMSRSSCADIQRIRAHTLANVASRFVVVRGSTYRDVATNDREILNHPVEDAPLVA